MPRHPNTPLIAAMIGTLLLSAFLCFTPLHEAGHPPVDRDTVTTTALGPDAERVEDRSPQHRHSGHGIDCSSPGVVPETQVATRHVSYAIALAASFGDTTTAAVTEGRAPPDGRTAIYGSGRSTQIRVCRWRI